jgi:hypothetical protein
MRRQIKSSETTPMTETTVTTTTSTMTSLMTSHYATVGTDSTARRTLASMLMNAKGDNLEFGATIL